jgi:hypothetical protein
MRNMVDEITPISLDDAAKVSGGMMKLPGPVVSQAPKSDTGWTWGTVSELPPSEGIGVVIHF